MIETPAAPHAGFDGPEAEEEWVIWNEGLGLVTTATLGQVETEADGRLKAWLDEPFDMVGPFDLAELMSAGRITFAACVVMSRLRWRDEQMALRAASAASRRTAQERVEAVFARHASARAVSDEQRHRETLNLPRQGDLGSAQIKSAFRRLARKAHPDVGGSHEAFLRITAAKNALLAQCG